MTCSVLGTASHQCSPLVFVSVGEGIFDDIAGRKYRSNAATNATL